MEWVQQWLNRIAPGTCLLALAILLFCGVILLLIFGKKQDPPIIREITLRDLSALWTRPGLKSIHIGELAPLWRDEHVIAGEDLRLPDIQNPRAAAFLDKDIRHGAWFQKAPLQKAVCGRILQMLDREGNCPSVVNMAGDVEGNWDENTYRLLARTTLLDHSLNVAEQVMRLLSESESWHVIPDTMVAALGHDLGKLEAMRGYLYSLGEHPLAAGRPLAGIAGFKELPKKDEILRAIKLHHKLPDGLLGKTLKKADQLARQKELEEATALITATEQAPNKTDVPEPQNEELPEVPPASEPFLFVTADKTAAAWQAHTDIYGEDRNGNKGKETRAVPQLMDISAWFDAGRFLEELKPYINKMFGRRFLAFSMPEGYVYFQTKVLEEVARKQAERAGCMEIAAMAQQDPTMRQVLLTIVHQLRVQGDIIARGLIKENFFGGYFTVTKKIGKSMKGYYTPFHAEAFGSIAEMEQNKSEILRNIQKVDPYLNDAQGQNEI